jgi:hypothetical protein
VGKIKLAENFDAKSAVCSYSITAISREIGSENKIGSEIDSMQLQFDVNLPQNLQGNMPYRQRNRQRNWQQNLPCTSTKVDTIIDTIADTILFENFST